MFQRYIYLCGKAKNVKKRGLDGFGMRSVRERREKYGSDVFISRVSLLEINGSFFPSNPSSTLNRLFISTLSCTILF